MRWTGCGTESPESARFCVMEDLDPEEARAIVAPALKLMVDAVHSYDGYMVQSTGDGIFALFGAPVAHEDHPQRALFAPCERRKRPGVTVRATCGGSHHCRSGWGQYRRGRSANDNARRARKNTPLSAIRPTWHRGCKRSPTRERPPSRAPRAR